MSSVARDMIEDHERNARKIQRFMWEGKPFRSKKKERTIQEFEEFLENLRNDCWSSYESGAENLGWKE